jgi:hypothetical protein
MAAPVGFRSIYAWARNGKPSRSGYGEAAFAANPGMLNRAFCSSLSAA